jgi:hypothetical protein
MAVFWNVCRAVWQMTEISEQLTASITSEGSGASRLHTRRLENLKSHDLNTECHKQTSHTAVYCDHWLVLSLCMQKYSTVSYSKVTSKQQQKSFNN